MNIGEYLVSVDDCGAITVVPIEDFGVLDKTDVFYIDMDGDIKQDIIDYCVNEDKEVILFGQDDMDDECDGDCENCDCDDYKNKNRLEIIKDKKNKIVLFKTNYFNNSDFSIEYSEYSNEYSFCNHLKRLIKDL